MAKLLSKSVMRWWPDEMVPHNRPAGAIAEARRLWEAAQLYEPFDISQQVAAKYGASQNSCAFSTSKRKNSSQRRVAAMHATHSGDGGTGGKADPEMIQTVLS